MVDQKEDKKEPDLHKAAQTLRNPNATPQEKHDAAVAMGTKGGSHSHSGSKKKSEDE